MSRTKFKSHFALSASGFLLLILPFKEVINEAVMA